MTTETGTPSSGNGIAEATAAFEKILAGPPVTREPKGEAEEDPVDETEAPEEATEDEAETPADEEGAEDEEAAANDDDSEEETEEPAERLITVKIDGKVEQLPEAEVAKGYQRQADYSRHMAALQQERSQVRADRDQYAQLLPAIQEVLQQQLSQEPDWNELYQHDPLEYVRQKEAFRERAEQLNAAQMEHQRVTQLQQQEQARELEARLVQGREELHQYNPTWKDKSVWERDRVKLREYGVQQGYSEEELSSAHDHRAVRLLHKAMKYDALMASKPQPARSEGPKPARPSAPQAMPSRKHSDQSKAKMRLAKTGSLKDAAKVFESLI